MQGPSIEFERVNLRLGATTILEDVSFKVRAGTIHCIVGANGGGKTSLVRSLLGQMPHSGRISIEWREGKDISDADWSFFYRCYARTYREHHSTPDLSLEFFRLIGRTMPENLLLVLAYRVGKPIAASFDVHVPRGLLALHDRPPTLFAWWKL